MVKVVLCAHSYKHNVPILGLICVNNTKISYNFAKNHEIIT